MIQWTPKRLSAFRAEIQRARQKRKAVAERFHWDENLERYVPLPEEDESGNPVYTVNVGADFRDVERKKAALFYDTPNVSFVVDDPASPLAPPQPPQPGQPPPPPPPTLGSLVSVHQRLVNTLLGPRYANAKAVVLKALFDVLCPAGIGPVQVGFDVQTVPVEQPGQPDPMTGLPGEPQAVDVPIYEEWWMARISPKAYLVPADHRDTDHTLAPWVGYDFTVPLSVARRRFKLPDDWKPPASELPDKPYFEDAKASQETGPAKLTGDPMVSGVYVEYRMADLAEATDGQVHPQQIACLVLLDGVDEPIKHEPSPHQQIDPQSARLTPDSITRYTIRPLLLRDLSDQAFVPSDCTVTASLTKEINKYRSVTVKQRDGNRVVMLYDPDKINPETNAKIDRGDVGTWIPVMPGALDQGQQSVMQQVTQLSQGRENWQGQDYLERDREQILGIGANQVGVQGKNSRTATEVSTIQRNTEARFEQERQRVLEWYLDLVCLFDTMVLRYADQQTAAKVLGPQAAQFWAQFKGQLAGSYRYEIQIDSGKYVDVEANKRQWLQLINVTGQSPHVNNVPVLKKLVAAYGLDPAQVIIDQPPQKKPEQKVSFTVSAEHLNPALPQFRIVLELLTQGGYQISPEAVNEAKALAQIQATVQAAVTNTAETPVPQPGTAPPQIPGTLPSTPLLNKKQSMESGDRPGPKVM